MSKLWAVTKVLLKTNFLSGLGESKKKKKKSLGIIGVFILLLLVFGSLGIPIIFSLDSVLEVLPIKNIIISFLLPLAGLTTIIFSVFSVVSVFYLSKDSDHLLHLPIDGKDILLSKFFVSLVNEYYILFMFILPCFIGVGVGIDAGVMYYIYMILIFLLLPVIPSIIVTFIILLVTRFTGVMKNKDLFMYISMALILVFALSYNYIIQNFISVDIENIGVTIGNLENNVLPYFRAVFPFYNSGASALINYNNLNGIFSLITFIGINLIFLIFIYFVGDKLYLKTLTISKGNKKKKEKIENVVSENIKNKNNSFIWLIKKEWLIIKRTPIFMLNVVIIVFLLPVVFAFSFLFAFSTEEVNVGMDASKISEYLENPFVYLLVILGCLFFTCSSMAASTSISREGSSAWFMKVVPISYFKQINAKVAFAVLLDLLGVIVIGIFPIIIYKIPIYYAFCVFVPVVMIVILLNYINIYLDLRKPKLNWSEESAAVKQNMNGLISMLMTLAISVIFGIIAFLFYYYNININVILLSVIISCVSGIMLMFVIYLFYKNRSKLLNNVN